VAAAEQSNAILLTIDFHLVINFPLKVYNQIMENSNLSTFIYTSWCCSSSWDGLTSLPNDQNEFWSISLGNETKESINSFVVFPNPSSGQFDATD